jgi:uncharacterized protein YwqG
MLSRAAVTIYDDQRRELLTVLRAALPAARADRIASLVRDTIAITPRKAKKADSMLGATRLGGCPDLPIGAEWPAKQDGDVEFVGQLRLEDLAPFDVHEKLPARGLLSFFHGFLTNGQYDAEARVMYFPDAPRGLATLIPPGRRSGPKPVAIDFAPLAMLPPHSSSLVPFEGDDDPYIELFDLRYGMYDASFWFHGLFGFDRPMESEQRDDEEILLRLDACGVPYDFCEAACAYYFIPRDALARGDFSTARLHEGASI